MNPLNVMTYQILGVKGGLELRKKLRFLGKATGWVVLSLTDMGNKEEEQFRRYNDVSFCTC